VPAHNFGKQNSSWIIARRRGHPHWPNPTATPLDMALVGDAGLRAFRTPSDSEYKAHFVSTVMGRVRIKTVSMAPFEVTERELLK